MLNSCLTDHWTSTELDLWQKVMTKPREQTFSPIAKPTIIQIVLNLALFHDWKVKTLATNNNFLNGDLEEEVYTSQPLGFVNSQKPHYLCKLKKAIHWLK